jgi:CrcB protein
MIFYVAIGSAFGGVTRYLIGGAVQRLLDMTFPIGTLFVNVSGSFLLGAILRYALETPGLTPEIRSLLTIGFCGGYTTFSTFSYETVALLKDGEWARAGFYAAASVLLSIAATFAGLAMAREAILWRTRI